MKNIFRKNIDKYGIINLLIWVALPVIVALIIVPKQDISNTTSSSSYNETTTTSSYNYNTTTTTQKKCQAYPCPNDAVAGSSYCSIHKKGKTKKCAKCGKAIWDDETFCDSCLYSSVINSKSKN